MNDAIEGMNGQDLECRSITVNQGQSRGSGVGSGGYRGRSEGGSRRYGGEGGSGGGYGDRREEGGGGYGGGGGGLMVVVGVFEGRLMVVVGRLRGYTAVSSDSLMANGGWRVGTCLQALDEGEDESLVEGGNWLVVVFMVVSCRLSGRGEGLWWWLDVGSDVRLLWLMLTCCHSWLLRLL